MTNDNDLEYRLGCSQMDTVLRIAPRIAPCCRPQARDITVLPSGDWDADFEKYETIINERINMLRRATSGGGECSSCHFLKMGWYHKTAKFSDLSFAGKIEGERCNCRCFYCDLTKSGDQVRHGEYKLDKCVNAVAKKFPEIKFLNYAPAEITVSPYKDLIFSLIREKGWKTKVFLTNGIIFDEELAMLLKTHSELGLNCSLDAGTAETFKRIKGVPHFDRVVSNLKKYADYGRVTLKYIILDGFNNNENEISAFMKIASELTDLVILAQNYGYQMTGDMPSSRLALFEFMVSQASTYGLKCGIHNMGFTAADRANIREFKERYNA